jgi:hypothetical protein
VAYSRRPVKSRANTLTDWTWYSCNTSTYCFFGVQRMARFRLGPRTYLTTGEKERRAWTVRAGDKAPVAAGVIHSDFEKSFISAETVAYEDLVACGSIARARELGKPRTEGKSMWCRMRMLWSLRLSLKPDSLGLTTEPDGRESRRPGPRLW